MTDQPAWYEHLTRRPDSPPLRVITPGTPDSDTVVITDPDAYATSALDRIILEFTAAPEGTRNPELNKAAFAAGRLIAAGLPLNETTVTERLEAACWANGLAADDGLTQCGKSIASGLRGGARHPLAWTQGTHHPATTDGGVFGPTPSTPASTGGTPPVETPVDPHQRAVDLEVARQRATRDARQLLDNENAAAAFKTPRPRTLRAFLDEPDIAPPYLIADVLPHGANVTLTAQFKTGKTTLLANLVAALVDNEPFLGTHKVTGTAGRIALFDYEMTEMKLRQWLREAGIRNVDAIDVVPLRGMGLALDHPAGREWATAWLRDHDIGVWIVDPFARAYLGDENDNGAVTAWTDALDVIKADAGVHTLAMAVHTGRAAMETARARGATRLDDWPDARWLFTKADGGVRYFTASGRDVDVEEVGLSYDTTTRRYTADLPGRRAAGIDADAIKVLEVLPALGHKPASLNDAIKALGSKNQSTSDRTKKAVKQLQVEKLARVEHRGNEWLIWRLSPGVFDSDEGP